MQRVLRIWGRVRVIIRNGVTGKGASTVNLQYLAFTLILLILLIYIRHTGKKTNV